MKTRFGSRRHSQGHARPHWVLVPVAVLASLVAVWSMQPLGNARMASIDMPSSADIAAGSSRPPAAVEAPVLDHSVVRSKQLGDEPDMTGASIGTYGP
jgi:hypothetical protein